MEFQLSYFKPWKIMLCKCFTQYATKFGKCSSGHRTGKSFDSNPKETMPKHYQTITQLHSSHTLAKQYFTFSKPGANSTWTMKFQMFKLDLGKEEEPEIKLPTSVGSWKKQESSEKISISVPKELTMPKPLTVWITTNWRKFFRPPDLPLVKSVCRSGRKS